MQPLQPCKCGSLDVVYVEKIGRTKEVRTYCQYCLSSISCCADESETDSRCQTERKVHSP